MLNGERHTHSRQSYAPVKPLERRTLPVSRAVSASASAARWSGREPLALGLGASRPSDALPLVRADDAPSDTNAES